MCAALLALTPTSNALVVAPLAVPPLEDFRLLDRPLLVCGNARPRALIIAGRTAVTGASGCY
jgi:hypothetical protein